MVVDFSSAIASSTLVACSLGSNGRSTPTWSSTIFLKTFQPGAFAYKSRVPYGTCKTIVSKLQLANTESGIGSGVNVWVYTSSKSSHFAKAESSITRRLAGRSTERMFTPK